MGLGRAFQQMQAPARRATEGPKPESRAMRSISALRVRGLCLPIERPQNGEAHCPAAAQPFGSALPYFFG